MVIRTGSSAYIIRGYEATFGAGTLNSEHAFGFEQKLNTLEFTNNQGDLPQLFTPEKEGFFYGKNAGSVNMEYKMANPFWLTALFNDPVTETDVAGVITRTWVTDPATNSAIRVAKSQHLEIGAALSPSNVVRNAKGVITQSMSLSVDLESPVTINENLVWGIEDAISTTLNGSVPGNSAFSVYMFTNSNVQKPDTTDLVKVQSLDLTLSRDQELLYGFNSPNATDAYPKLAQMSGKVNLAFGNKDIYQEVVDRAELATMTLIFTNGLAGTSERSITLSFSGVGLSKHSNPVIEPGEPIFQEFDFTYRTVSAVSVDATAIFTWN